MARSIVPPLSAARFLLSLGLVEGKLKCTDLEHGSRARTWICGNSHIYCE